MKGGLLKGQIEMDHQKNPSVKVLKKFNGKRKKHSDFKFSHKSKAFPAILFKHTI